VRTPPCRLGRVAEHAARLEHDWSMTGAEMVALGCQRWRLSALRCISIERRYTYSSARMGGLTWVPPRGLEPPTHGSGTVQSTTTVPSTSNDVPPRGPWALVDRVCPPDFAPCLMPRWLGSRASAESSARSRKPGLLLHRDVELCLSDIDAGAHTRAQSSRSWRHCALVGLVAVSHSAMVKAAWKCSSSAARSRLRGPRAVRG
jgi:hypothetical protein